MRAALFDVGGTLLETRGDPWRPLVLEAIRREFGARPWAETLYDADIRRPAPDDPHRQETNRWLSEWLKANGEELGEADVERLRGAFAAPIDYGPHLCEGATAALRWCKARGLTVVLITNMLSTGDAEAWRNWRRTEAADVIDHVVTSHSVGWAKPHPAMFERALALAGAPASEAFMVGDDLDVDIAGAGALGIRTVWKRPRGAGRDQARRRPDAVIASLRELPAALEPWIRA